MKPTIPKKQVGPALPGIQPKKLVAEASKPVAGVLALAFALFVIVSCGGQPGQTGGQIPTPSGQGNEGAFNYAPKSKTVKPLAVYATNGTVQNPTNVLTGHSSRLIGKGSSITLDFGKEVGGIITLQFAGTSDANQNVGLAFSESSLFIGPNSDASSGYSLFFGPNSDASRSDGAIYTPVSGLSTYTVPSDKLRGGFRYLTIFLSSDGSVDVSDISLQFTASPIMADLRAYPNYFSSNDELLNRIWYAGSYTVQMDTIDPTQGRVWPPPPAGWENNAPVGTGSTILVDGAKRDRTTWPGDLAIAQATAFVSTNDTVSVRNALTTLYKNQDVTGAFPYAGPMVSFYGSDTYHLWTLVATAEYYLYSADKTWLENHWNQYKTGVAYSLRKIDDNGVLSVDQPYDWGRTAPAAGETIEANAILYHVLTTGAYLAQVEADSATAQAFTSTAQSLKQAINARFWDAGANQYSNTPGSNLHPQDGNSLAVWYGVVDSTAKVQGVSQALQQNWNSYGAATPEKANAIATFPGSMEVHAHFAAGDDQTALDLIRLEWGYMLNSPNGTNSTFWEGYLTDGTFDYLGSYMSLAHGWSTGPTSALTFYVLGISPTTVPGIAYTVAPHPGDLMHAEGRLTMPIGTVSESWTRDTNAGTFTQILTAPANIIGRIGVPTFGHSILVFVDDQLVWNGSSRVGAGVSTDGAYVYLDGLSGNHTVRSADVAAQS